jgi:alanine dehydrogenase
MRIGMPKEVKELEFRVGLTPACVEILVQDGHEVVCQKGAGDPIGFDDEQYRLAGAEIAETADEVYLADMVVKVKEPVESEYSLIKEGQILFCYLHLAPNRALTEKLVESGCVAIAYETVTDEKGRLPLLVPMSEIAGRIGAQEGAHALQMVGGGKGVLLGGAPGVLPGKVVVIGGGVAGTEAARIAIGMGADATILDNNLARLKELELSYAPMLKTLYSNPVSVAVAVSEADLVIGSVLIPGKTAPKLITREMLKRMDPGSVIVDIAIDQGGCTETSRPTTHTRPTYTEEGVVHYCVTNMPAACSRTSSLALTNATLNYVRKLAKRGYKDALESDPGLLNGLNVCKGAVTNEHVAADLGFDYKPPKEELK